MTGQGWLLNKPAGGHGKPPFFYINNVKGDYHGYNFHFHIY